MDLPIWLYSCPHLLGEGTEAILTSDLKMGQSIEMYNATKHNQSLHVCTGS